MQKKIIALAIAGLAAAPAFAQNVQIYGRLDIGLTYTSADSKGVTLDEISANRWGFKGEEDLGGGLSAYFQLENRFMLDNGRQRDTDTYSVSGANGVGRNMQWTDKAWVGLNYKPVGKAAFGRILTVQNGGLMGGGDYEALTDTNASVLARNGQKQDGLSNAMYAETASFGGFQMAFHKQFSEAATGGKGGYGILATYRGGPVKTVLLLQRDVNTRSPQNNASGGTVSTLGNPGDGNAYDANYFLRAFGFAYDFGFMKFKTTANIGKGGKIGDGITGNGGASNYDFQQRAWQYSFNFPVGQGEIGAALSFRRVKGAASGTSYTQGTGETISPQEVRYSLGYQHNLSKRTKLIATTAMTRSQSKGDATWTIAGDDAKSHTWVTQLGMRHEF